MKKGSAGTNEKYNGMSSEAVAKRTGKSWKEWLAILDKQGAKKMAHPGIASMVHTKFGCPGWWSQMVTVGYEQARGLRIKHQTAAGFSISRSVTLPVSTAAAYKAWDDSKSVRKWLGETGFERRTSHKNKTMRLGWVDGKTTVEIGFYPKGAQKCSVAVQHNKLADAKSAAKMKSYWEGKLDRLRTLLTS